ncbi:MAG TPA: dihydrodipicolinate synthase family protein, partial [Saprospiraceae bacterium]|nr:dihydrodipicolinate synthase family protein [Saprospiraceae bacterium]
GVIIGGSLGESSTLSHDDRLTLLACAIKAIGSEVDIILNIAEGSTSDAIELAKKAEKNGADGLMLLPPMMYKPTDEEVVRFFADVAQNTTLPILLYNNPVDYKILISIDMLGQLAPYSNIQAIKESTRDISNVTRTKNAFGDRYKILCGVDTIAVEELVMGADGWVAGLIDAFPKETVMIYKYVKEGKINEARDLFRWFLPLLELDIDPQLVQNIKLAAVYTGIGTETVRPPRQVLSGQRRKEVVDIIETALKDRPVFN